MVEMNYKMKNLLKNNILEMKLFFMHIFLGQSKRNHLTIILSFYLIKCNDLIELNLKNLGLVDFFLKMLNKY